MSHRTRTCSIEGCESTHHARGFCIMHYQRWEAHGDPLMVKVPDPPEVGVWRFVQQGAGCWLWTGAKTGPGYGNFRGLVAHRVVFELLVGPIPEGLQLDHLCRVRHCVNPEHLEPVTGAENLRRGVGPSAVNARKTHCPQGHPYDAVNTYIPPNGRPRRRCRICMKAQAKRGREKAKAT